ncbi:MAG: penicillin-binding protein 2 [Ardenticatenaceae bacterium]|nr:penicillin-binding protein 2 [Ardenticatenaceae bacterium]
MGFWDRQEREDRRQAADTAFQGRLYFFRIIIVVSISLLLYRVFWLQQIQGNQFVEQARENRTARLLLDAPRGVIFDRNGEPLAVNEPSFNVTITPAFLPSDEGERLAVFERLSLLTGVPVTNTLAQEQLIDAADPVLRQQYADLAELYGAPVDETLDNSGLIPQLPSSIQDVYETFSFAQYLPATIKSGITITEAYLIEQESVYLPGVRIIPEPIRRYPTGELTSHLIGFMGPLPSEAWLALGYQRDDRVGLAGLEVSLEPLLAGNKGERQIVTDWTGREIRQLGTTITPQPGYNVHLTLDMELQAQATEILSQTLQARREFADVDFFTGLREFREVELGVIVALDPRSGEVLAMVNLPAYDNNRFATEIPVDYYLGLVRNEYEPFLNHAIAGQYPPGSTFKVVTVAAALQEGVVSANRLLETPGTITIANQFAPNDPGRAQEFVCWISLPPNFGDHGAMNAYTGMAQSCDIYMYKIAGGFRDENIQGLGINTLGDYARQFGFGEIQGIELPLEAPGIIPNTEWKQINYGEPWSTGDDYNAAIGQGYVLSTPLQVAQMAAVVANGGFLYRPRLVHHLTDDLGNVYALDEDFNPIPAEDAGVPIDENGEVGFVPQVLDVLDVDQEFVDVVAEGMRLVNTMEGTGTSYIYDFDEDQERIPDWLLNFGIETAGKTGTSEFCDNLSQRKGWCTEEKILNGEVLPTHAWYVGYAPFDDPEIVVVAFMYNGGEGSQWAAPMVREVMAAYFEVDDYAPVEPEDDPQEQEPLDGDVSSN